MAVGWIGLHLTDRCQLDCHHCLRDPSQIPADLDLSLIRRVLADARRIYKSAHVALTGGEPTLHPEFEAIIDAIVENDFTWHVVTNGRRFSRLIAMLKAKPARRAALRPVNFSLDGADEATHDAIRERGSYRDVMTAVSLSTIEGLPFVLQMVINAKNVHQIEAMGLLASQLGAARVSFSMLQATGTHHDHDLGMSARAWRDAQDRVERLASALKIEVSMPEGWHKEQPFHVCQPFASQQLHVDVHGRLNLCCQHAGVPSEDGSASRDVAGSLHEMSLADAHKKLLAIIHAAQAARLDRVTKGELTAWDYFPCNDCLKHFKKPHWSDEGREGPDAKRERWRGAWAARNALPIYDERSAPQAARSTKAAGTA